MLPEMVPSFGENASLNGLFGEQKGENVKDKIIR